MAVSVHYTHIIEEYKYGYPIIHVGINAILRNENDPDVNNLPDSILEIPNTCQLNRYFGESDNFLRNFMT